MKFFLGNSGKCLSDNYGIVLTKFQTEQPFCPNENDNENVPEKSGSITFECFWTSNFMQNIRKTNEPILRKVSQTNRLNN